MQIAISGSTGLIGSALCDRLQAQDHRLLRLVRPQSDTVTREAYGNNNDVSVEWDPQHGLADPMQLNGIDAVFHLAGRSIAARRWTAKEKQRIRDSRVPATRKLSEQLAQLPNPPKKFISVSAIGFYGDCGDRVVDETTASGDDFLAEVARQWEAAAEPMEESGVSVIHPRLGLVLAASGGALEKMLPIFRWYLGGRLGSGQQYWSWIALEDCISALIWLLDQPQPNAIYNFVTPHPVTNAEFTRTLAAQLGRPVSLPVPAFALRLAMGEMADSLLLSSCRVAPKFLVEDGFEFTLARLDDALSAELQRDH